jgi:ABC-type oligopeptide transport system substrate-binding subunit
MSYLRRSVLALAAVAGAIGLNASAHAQKTLRVVMHSDLKILDPIWTTAYIVRNHGYMIYDTLFATDATGEIKPQMVGNYELSADKLTHTFTLRGLHRPKADDVRREPGGERPKDLRHEAQIADRACALGAWQTVLQRTLHDAKAGG